MWPLPTAALAFVVTATTVPAPLRFEPQALWEAWPELRAVTLPAPCLRPAQLAANLDDLSRRQAAAAAEGWFEIETVGHSVAGRPIRLLRVGRGARRVLAWSQMHGDEPSATPALLDLAEALLSRRHEPAVRAVLEKVTLLAVPMLNPDGAESYTRRNLQGIDINRDALSLATPEGRLLKDLRQRFDPELCFNLHDQDRRTVVGATGVRAHLALLAVAGDPQGTLTPGRARAKRASAALVAALRGFVPGGIARYDEDWNPRAFGDNLTAWGTPVVLIESGAPLQGDFTSLTRLNFVGLASVLHDLARNDLAGHDPALYDALPRNLSGAWADVVVRNGQVLWPGMGEAPFAADLAFNLDVPDTERAACAGPTRPRPEPGPARSRVVEIGDARLFGAGEVVGASKETLLPPFSVGLEGLAAGRWLDAAAVELLGRLGVGRIAWYVSAAEAATAEQTARALASPGRPVILVERAQSTVRPSLMLSGPPTPPVGRDLDALLSAIAGDATALDLQRAGDVWTALRNLVQPYGSPLTLGGPASFVIVRQVESGHAALDGLRLESVWLDGRRQAPARSR